MSIDFAVDNCPTEIVWDDQISNDLISLAEIARMCDVDPQNYAALWVESCQIFWQYRDPKAFGYSRQPVIASLNMSNVNGVGFVKMLKLEDFAEVHNGERNLCVGRVPVACIPTVQKVVSRLLESTEQRRQRYAADSDAANCDNLEYKFTTIGGLLEFAVANNRDFVWY